MWGCIDNFNILLGTPIFCLTAVPFLFENTCLKSVPYQTSLLYKKTGMKQILNWKQVFLNRYGAAVVQKTDINRKTNIFK